MDLKVRLGNNGCRLSLFISKPVGARFEQMGSKTWVNFVAKSHLTFAKISSIIRKTAAIHGRPETVIKNSFEEMEHEFPFETFRTEKQDYLFRNSVPPGNFQLGETKNSVSFTFQLDFPEPELSFC